MTHHVDGHPAQAFRRAERRLFAACGVQATSRRVALADPPVAVRVLEAGDGPPLVLVHGSGMSASTWAPLMPYLSPYRLIAFDLPGFGRPAVARRGRRPADRVWLTSKAVASMGGAASEEAAPGNPSCCYWVSSGLPP